MLFAQAQTLTTTATLAPTTTAKAPDIQPYVVQSTTAPTAPTAPTPTKKSGLTKWLIFGGGVLAAASLAFFIVKK